MVTCQLNEAAFTKPNVYTACFYTKRAIKHISCHVDVRDEKKVPYNLWLINIRTGDLLPGWLMLAAFGAANETDVPSRQGRS